MVGNQVPVDRYLVRQDKRDEWCRRLVDEASALGLPLLVEPAPALLDYLYRGQPNDPVATQPVGHQGADPGS